MVPSTRAPEMRRMGTTLRNTVWNYAITELDKNTAVGTVVKPAETGGISVEMNQHFTT